MDKILFGILKNSKNYKKIAWFFIIVILLLIVFYPIIDTNFLYYNRVSNRIDILEKVSKLDENEIKKDKRVEKEYNSIVDEIFEKENNYLNNIFITESSTRNKLIKFFSSAWLLVLVGLILPFTKDDKKGKRTFMNFISGVICVGVGCGFGYIGLKIPTVINVVVNVILYQIIMIFFAYTIYSFGNKGNN